jgi:hypothetical protein
MNDNEPLFSLNPEADGISYAFVFHRLNFGLKSKAEQCLKAKAPQRVGNSTATGMLGTRDGTSKVNPKEGGQNLLTEAPSV